MRDVLAFAAEILGVSAERLSPETTCGSISEWDSIAQLRLMTEVQARFGVEIPFAEVTQVTSLWELARRVNGGAVKKVVAVDFDNTLWKGIVGEDGPESIVPDLALQRELKELKDRGVLLVGLSKNNEEDGLAGLDVSARAGGLCRDDFVALKVNWSPKAENLAVVAEELNLGLDSFVFVDDRPSERIEMSLRLPEVSVTEFPPVLAAYFPSRTLTEEDRHKTEEYRAEAKRREIIRRLPEAVDVPQRVFEALGVVLDVHELRENEVSRVAQLSQKANQLNVCTNRYSEADVQGLSREGLVVTARAKDRFGDQGLVAYVVVRDGEIFDWVMSCRAMGRGVEEKVEEEVERLLAALGVAEVKATWRDSGKNGVAKELFERFGFALEEATAGERKYRKRLTGREER